MLFILMAYKSNCRHSSHCQVCYAVGHLGGTDLVQEGVSFPTTTSYIHYEPQLLSWVWCLCQ